MRSAVIIFGAAILARVVITPVYYLVEDTDDATAPTTILAGSLESCEQALVASVAPRAHCRSVPGYRHLLASGESALASLRQAADAALQPVGELQDSALDAVQDAAAEVVQDAAVDAVQDAIGGDDSPLE
jgi:L-aminopeptidase/D-esterase-like protein